jgi:DNA-directed RNA polymerase subunit RPC12/RpoP
MAEFKPAKCPNCSGEMQIPLNMEKVKCMYCGGDILVQEAVQKYHFEISGNVKLDRKAEIENYKKIGSREFEDGNFKDSFEYYTRVLEIDTEDFDALMYRGLSRAWQSTLINNELLDANKGAKRALEIYQNNGCTKEDLYLKIDLISSEIYKVIIAIFDLATRHYSENHYGVQTAEEYWIHLLLCVESLEGIIELHSEEMTKENIFYKENKIHYLKELIIFYVEICNGKKYIDINSNVSLDAHINPNMRATITEKYDLVVSEIRKHEPTYNPKFIARTKSGCYIATAIYGDYNAPEVMTLRSFRDTVLKKYYLGRLFIKVYYAVSPSLATRLQKTVYINRTVKKVLDGFVNKLNNKC